MKVVINDCFGGFSLSPLATVELAKRKWRECYLFGLVKKDGILDFNSYRGPLSIEESNKEFIVFAFDIPNPNELVKGSDKGYEDHSINNRPKDRADSDLIAVVEALGDKADGKQASLKVVEIPDGTDYVITEYDGNEHIAEVHRTWS